MNDRKDIEKNNWTTDVRIYDPCDHRKRIDNLEKRLLVIEFFDKTLRKLKE